MTNPDEQRIINAAVALALREFVIALVDTHQIPMSERLRERADRLEPPKVAEKRFRAVGTSIGGLIDSITGEEFWFVEGYRDRIMEVMNDLHDRAEKAKAE